VGENPVTLFGKRSRVVSAAHIAIGLSPTPRATKAGSATADACRRAGAARIDLTGNVAGAVTPAAAKRSHRLLSERRRRKLAAHATVTCRRSDAGDSAIRTKTKGHGAPSRAPVAKGVRLRHEKYPVC
jgi:sRNA-binding protein